MTPQSPPAVMPDAPDPGGSRARPRLQLVASRTEALLPDALTSGLLWSLVATTVLATWILFDLGGWRYYTTPLGVRGYLPQHRLLRPTGAVAHVLGVSGAALMFVPVAYMVRKRLRWLHRFGTHRVWLELHIFRGILGPVLVTFHTSLKFNGLISVAYWFMVAVAASGFVGRYLYVRIPRTIRGVELTREEILLRSAALDAELTATGVSDEARAALGHYAGIAQLDRRCTLARWVVMWRARGELRRCRLAIVCDGLSPRTFDTAVRHARERATLARRLRTLQQTKRFFGFWHVFHLPLVWLMFAIVALHIGLTLYLGYWPFHWAQHG